MEQLQKQTNELLHQLDYFKTVFAEEKLLIGDQDDFARVKKETLPTLQLLERWSDHTLQLIKQRKLNIHPQQIDATQENYEMFLMHSYFKDIRRRKYIETYRSCVYVFNLIIGELEDEKDIN